MFRKATWVAFPCRAIGAAITAITAIAVAASIATIAAIGAIAAIAATSTTSTVAAAAAPPAPRPAPSAQDSCFTTVTDFYHWVLKNGPATDSLRPTIVDVPGTTHFRLDLETLPKFTAMFLRSGLFSKDFPGKVETYYRRYGKQFEEFTQPEFDEMAKDGRGPMMEVEDMDLFFCAQEYEDTEEFIGMLTVASFQLHGDKGEMVVESSYGWKTDFEFVRVRGRWLIDGYCVFR